MFLFNLNSRRNASSTLIALLAITLLASALLPSAQVEADDFTLTYSDALVLVNSASSYYPDFAHYIKPYLDYFGIPYSTLDIKTTGIPSDLGKHSLIVVGHRNLDPPHTYLSSVEEEYIKDAVNAGSGLVNFDSALTQTPATVEFLCSDNAHQDPVYTTVYSSSELKHYDNDWDEFKWTGRDWPGMFAFTTESPRVITFYANVPNGEYDVVACLYNSAVGSTFTYYYSFSNHDTPSDKSISYTATVADHAEYSLGPVTVDDGRFELYTNSGLSSAGAYGWFYIRLTPHATLTPLYNFVQQIFAFDYTQPVSATSIQSVGTVMQINCWEDDHQDPVLPTITDHKDVLSTDGLWSEFKWEMRDYPVVCAWTNETDILQNGMRFYTSGVPNGEYNVFANLYGRDGLTTYRYYYSINNGPEMHIDVTHSEMAELPIGTVTITDGNFQLYTRGGDLLSGEDYTYAWGWIRLIPSTGERHYVISSQPIGNTITLYSSITATGIVTHSPATTLLELVSGGGTHPLLIVTDYGQGRAVQWATYEFLDWSKLGYFIGLDDVFWRSFVWAARKPFVMQGMLPFVTLRVDDCNGPFNWIQEAYDASFTPIAATFISPSTGAIQNPSELAAYVQQGKAIVCVHERTAGGDSWWGNLDTEEKAAQYWALSDALHIGYDIPYSKTLLAHNCEIGSGLIPGMQERGIEFIGSEIDIGVQWGQQFSYYPGPYMKYQHPASGRCHYLIADWVADGSFFNLYVNPYAWFSEYSHGDWLQDFMSPPNVQGAINTGIQRFKRSLDSMAVGIYLTHEPQIETMGYENFGAVMAGIHEGIASYNPIYTDYDTMSRYVRAMTTSDITSAVYDTSSNVISVTLAGHADIATKFYYFNEENGQIKSELINVPAFTDSVTVNAPATTALTIGCNPTTVIKTGTQTTTISGALTSGGSGPDGKAIKLYYQEGASGQNVPPPTEGSWTYIDLSTTESGGSYSYTWDPPETLTNGYYWIKASFEGDANYAPSFATTGVDMVSNLFVIPEYAVGTILALGVCFAGVAVYRRSKHNRRKTL